MYNQYQYPDGTRGAARQFIHDDSVIPAAYLAQRDGETDAAWSARLARVDVTPIRITPSEADPNAYDAGDPVEVTQDGVVLITCPTPVAKTPVWSMATGEQMYISAGADVPPGYTTLEPSYGVYSLWDAAAEAWTEDADGQAAVVRAERDRLLTACDWTQLTDCPLDDTATAAWVTYRQALRDVPQQAGFPATVVWPEKPE